MTPQDLHEVAAPCPACGAEIAVPVRWLRAEPSVGHAAHFEAEPYGLRCPEGCALTAPARARLAARAEQLAARACDPRPARRVGVRG